MSDKLGARVLRLTDVGNVSIVDMRRLHKAAGAQNWTFDYGEGDIDLSACSEGGRVTVAVSNAAAPILEEALATLFDPLTPTPASPQRRGTAACMGLGLYICKQIAKAHDGEITVTSGTSRTTFTVTLLAYSWCPVTNRHVVIALLTGLKHLFGL